MRQVLLLLVAQFATNAALADDRRVAVTPFGGYRFSGDLEVQGQAASLELADDASFGVLLNVDNDARTTWEVLYSRQRTEARLDDPATASGPTDTDIQVLQLGGTYHGEGEKLRPYVAMTLGGTHVRTSGTVSEADTFWSGSLGAGIEIMPGGRFGLRLEIRAYGTVTDSNTDLFCSTGPDLNVCAIRIESELLSQIEAFAGLTFRY